MNMEAVRSFNNEVIEVWMPNIFGNAYFMIELRDVYNIAGNKSNRPRPNRFQDVSRLEWNSLLMEHY